MKTTTKKVQVDVKEIWDYTVEVVVPINATRKQIIEAADEVLAEGGDPDLTEYNRTLDSDQWTIRDENGFIS